MRKYYTDKQYKELIKDIVIFHDTREQENEHILSWFNKKGVKHQNKALEIGDYSFAIDNDWYDDEVFIERKNSLDELAQSILQNRFKLEIREASLKKHKYIIIEGGSYADILKHNYNSNYNPKAFWNTLMTYQAKYNIHVIFTNKEQIGQMIYSICKSVLNISLKHN